jgi:hypothetical protein
MNDLAIERNIRHLLGHWRKEDWTVDHQATEHFHVNPPGEPPVCVDSRAELLQWGLSTPGMGEAALQWALDQP